MNLATLFVSALIAVIVILDIRYLMKHGLEECSGDCSGCGPSCKWGRDIKKAQRRIRFEKKVREILHIR